MSNNIATKEQKWDEIEAEFRDDSTKLSSFYENPVPVLKAANIETALIPPAQVSVKATGEKISVTKHWWGQNFIMNEKLTSDIIHGIEGTGGLAALISAATGIGIVLTAGIALAFILKRVEIQLVDNGKGVYWPITWIQWGLLAAAVPTGPTSIAGAAALWLHPFRN